MAGLSSSIGQAQRSSTRRVRDAAVGAPRLLMSWEDWLTFGAVMLVFLTVAASIESANWVNRMPPMIPTAIAGLLVGLFAARIRLHAAVLHPIAVTLGIIVVVLAAQSYADGAAISDRLADFRVRMVEWFNIVRAGDISNDNLPFVTLVHGVTFLAAYLGTWSVYRWHNPWLAVIPGGIVLLANISAQRGQPAAAFVFYLFGAMLLIARLHLQKRQSEWREQGIDYPDFVSLSAAQLTVAIVTVLMVTAWLVPLGTQARAVESALERMSGPLEDRSDFARRLFHNLNAGTGGNFHDFGDVLPIRGDVDLGSRQLYEVRAPDAGFLRGTSYDHYTGVGWRQSDRDSIRVDAAETLAGDPEDFRDRRPTSITVTVRDEESTILFAGLPLGTNRDAIYRTPEGAPEGAVQVVSRRGLGDGDTYNAIGTESIASPESLRNAGTDYSPAIAEYYLQLPDDLPQRVRDSALAIVGENRANPYDSAVALEEHLRGFRFDYTVPAAPPGRDTVDYFLADLQAGYPDYSATAMAVMLRTLGVPARIAVGYAIDAEEVTPDGNFIVRKDDAYAWVEVYFPGFGWVTFNPSPDRPSGDGAVPPIGQDFIPGPPVEEIPPELIDDGGITIPVGSDLGDALNEEPVNAPAPFPWWIAWTLAGVLGAFAMMAVGARLAWTWGTGGLPARLQQWARIQRVARWAGLASEPEETAREWSRRVGATVRMPDEATTLARAYEEARYGRPDLERADDEEVAGAYVNLRNRLFRRVIRRRERQDNGADDLDV